MAVRYVALGLCASVFFFGQPALAEDNLAGFGNIAGEQPTPPVQKPLAPRKKLKAPAKEAVSPTAQLSIATVAPGLLPFFNNAPVFGLPGTVSGSFWDRTQLTGDWGGARTDLARRGFFFDLYSTTALQDVTSGGLKTGTAPIQNTQLSINVDTQRAGLWSGGLIHFTAQSRYGNDPSQTFTVGSYVPQYTALVEPGPLLSRDTLPSEYFLAQALSKQFSVVLGKISDVFIPDQTLFGNSYKYYFANFNFNKNPMTTNFYNPTAWAALAVWTPAQWLAIAGGVLDPNSQADNFATDAFDRVNLYLTAVASYQIEGLPGQFSPALNWSNKPKIDLTAPFGPLTSVAQVTQAVGVLVGSGMTANLPINFNSESWFAIANVSQYLFVKDDSETVTQKLKSGQPINGVGIFARAGYAPQGTNTVTIDASVALFAHGLFDARPYDSFGVGYYWNQFSADLKNDIATLTLGMANLKNESGVEVFYDFAITPAIRLIPSYQHIWFPLTAQVATNQNSADVFLARVNLAF
jgi:carbohydrate-selective porin OprB